MPARTKFSLLSEPPQPLPEEGERAEAPAAAPAGPPALSAGTPASARPAPRRSGPTPVAPAVTAPAALTVRLRRSAAEPLNQAWLSERQTTDPKLSYPEFASMIVQLGLAAWERKQRGKTA